MLGIPGLKTQPWWQTFFLTARPLTDWAQASFPPPPQTLSETVTWEGSLHRRRSSRSLGAKACIYMAVIDSEI
jgi:hypothetical protein